MNNKMLSDYTENDFLNFVRKIYHADKHAYPTEDLHVKAVMEFERLSEHPDKSDLIYYPREGREDSPEGVVKEVKEWRAANGKPGFKVV